VFLSKKIIIEVFHVLIALEIVLAYLYAISLFKPKYVILSRGIIWSRVYSIDSTYETLIPLAVALAISVCVYAIGGFKAVKLAKVSVYVLAILTVVCGLPLAYWIAYMWSSQVSQNHNLMRLSELDAGLFHVYAPVYPLLLLATLYAWSLSTIAKTLKERVRLKVRYNMIVNANGGYDLPASNTLTKRIYLSFTLLLSIALPLIPYIPSINPTFKPVSVDIRWYSVWLDNMLMVNCWNAIKYAFYGKYASSRPLYLLLLYGLINLGVSKQIVLNFEALFISPFFTLAVYYAAKRLSGSRLYALLTSLAAVLGFNMTVGMMAGFFAAWIALIPFYICVALTPDLTGGSLKSLAILLASSIVMLYIHPWTWSLLMVTLTLHLAFSTLQSLRKGNFKLDRHLLTVLVGNAIADIVKTLTYPSSGGLASSTAVLGYSRAFGLEPLLDLPRNLHRLTVSYVDGLFFNPLHMALALIGVLSLSKKGEGLSRLLVIWLAVVSLLFPFSSIGLQSHLLFATPFPILIAEGLWALSRLLARFDSKLPKLFIIFFITSSLTYTVRALCNLI
jgi:hypothetical protein